MVTALNRAERSSAVAQRLFDGPGKMRAHFRAFDWCATPLGGADTWPVCLKTAVQLMLSTRTPASVYCGPEFVLLYNDAASAFFPEGPLRASGRPAREALPGTWKRLLPLLEQTWAGLDTV